jgi:hypothetical protein
MADDKKFSILKEYRRLREDRKSESSSKYPWYERVWDTITDTGTIIFVNTLLWLTIFLLVHYGKI